MYEGFPEKVPIKCNDRFLKVEMAIKSKELERGKDGTETM